jgi:membrane protein DedA with SNARE-associated domain
MALPLGGPFSMLVMVLCLVLAQCFLRAVLALALMTWFPWPSDLLPFAAGFLSASGPGLPY